MLPILEVIGIRLGLNKKKFGFNFMVLNNTICYVGKICKYGLVHAADESKVVVQGLDGYIVAEKNGQLLVCSLKEEQRIKEFGK